MRLMNPAALAFSSAEKGDGWTKHLLNLIAVQTLGCNPVYICLHGSRWYWFHFTHHDPIFGCPSSSPSRQAVASGSPDHPSYPAGHAVQNGAFATVLKVRFRFRLTCTLSVFIYNGSPRKTPWVNAVATFRHCQ